MLKSNLGIVLLLVFFRSSTELEILEESLETIFFRHPKIKLQNLFNVYDWHIFITFIETLANKYHS